MGRLATKGRGLLSRGHGYLGSIVANAMRIVRVYRSNCEQTGTEGVDLVVVTTGALVSWCSSNGLNLILHNPIERTKPSAGCSCFDNHSVYSRNPPSGNQ